MALLVETETVAAEDRFDLPAGVRRTERTIAAFEPERLTLLRRAYGCTPRDARANGSAPHFTA